MCKTSWEIYSLWALDPSGDQVVITTTIIGSITLSNHYHPQKHQRWVCTSGRPEDLATTDRLAKEVLEQQVEEQDNDDND